MAWFRGTRIETAENAVANARANQQANAKEMEMAYTILRRYHTPRDLLRRFCKDEEVARDISRIFSAKLGYEIYNPRFLKERGEERVEFDCKLGHRSLLVNQLEAEVIHEVDLVAHTYAEIWYKKRMDELFPLAYYRAHQSAVHSTN